MWTRALRQERTDAIVANINTLFNNISTDFCQNRDKYEGNFIIAIKANLTIQDAHAVIKKCSECKCCEVHQTNRPIILNMDWDSGAHPSHQEYSRECKCVCRHFSRWICHAFYEINEDA